MSKKIWVFSDMESRYPELLAGAATLGDDVTAFVVGAQADAAKALHQGAARVVLLPPDESRMVEDYAPTMAQCIKDAGNAGVVLIGATKRGKTVAAKLGVALSAAVVNEASAIKSDDAGLAVTHMVYGGLASGVEKVSSPLAVISVGGGVYEPLAEDAGRTGEVVAAAFVEPAVRIKRLERRPKQGSSVDLGKARRVVSVGRGLKSEADLKMIRDLAAVLEAEVGCSRPIAEGENWLERERYVGVTGVMLKADVYLALGISGQIQHMVGANGSRTIVAVNKDKNAPIFQYADYGLVGDIYKVVPALTALLGN
jgi:electron transfer flavoprotein alpha subunit